MSVANDGDHDLALPDGQDDYGNDLYAWIRHGRFADASARLAADIAALSPELWEICAACCADKLSVLGWPALNVALADPTWSHISAIGIDLFGREKNTTGEPSIRLLFFGDRTFPFSTAGRAAIMAENVCFGSPWHGFADASNVVDLTIAGMAELHSVIVEEQARRERPEPGSDAAIALFLAEWWRTVKFHHLIHTTFARYGLARDLVLIVGSLDCGPFVETVYARDAPAGAHPSSTDFQIDEEFDEDFDPEPEPEPEPEAEAEPEVTPVAFESTPLSDPWSRLVDRLPAPEREKSVVSLAPPLLVNEDSEIGEFSASELRKRLAAAKSDAPIAEKPSLLGRLFSRR